MAKVDVYRVTCRMASDIINGSNPERVKVYCEDPDGMFTAVDNSSGEAFTEDFATEADAIEWLTSDITAEEIRERHKPKYVPFDLSKEEDRDALRGKWVKLDQDGFFYELQITEFICICDEASTYMVRLPNGSQKTGEELLLFFVFLDGSPCCGKPANSRQMEEG